MVWDVCTGWNLVGMIQWKLLHKCKALSNSGSWGLVRNRLIFGDVGLFCVCVFSPGKKQVSGNARIFCICPFQFFHFLSII